MATAQATAAPTRTHLSLKGSTAIVNEFFEYSVQSILFQRGIYPAEDFKPVKKYGLQMLVTTDDALQEYLQRAMGQLKEWLHAGQISRLVVAIVDKDSQETVERWQFDVDVVGVGTDEIKGEGKENGESQTGATALTASEPSKPGKQKTDQQVKSEIAAIIKQITASCTFLPVIDANSCAFNILAYTSRDTTVPLEWTESDARLIREGAAEQVKLRSFSTNVHRVEAMVAYKRDEEDE